MHEQEIGTTAVIGLGLIGGSLAIDLSRAGVRVLGFDAEQGSLCAALEANAVAAALDDSLGGLSEADVVVLAVPVDAAIALMPRVAMHARHARLITDVGSTKTSVVSAASAAGLGGTFVGGHPLAGDDRAGWIAARPGLFQGARVLLTPDATASPASIRLARRLWEALGAVTEDVDAAQHDRELAWTSHVPQVLSSTLAIALERAGLRSTALGAGGRGMVRLAGSSPGMWVAIAMENRDSIDAALGEVATVLDEFRRALHGAHCELREAQQHELRSLFATGRAWIAPASSHHGRAKGRGEVRLDGSATVAFQGEIGAYSDEAARSFFNEPVDPLPCRSFADVCDAVLHGRARFGVLPVENTSAGSVVAAYDALTRPGILVLGEVVRPIRHAVLGVPGAALGRLRRIISHPVALAQCTQFFEAHRWIEAVASYDTAGAAIEVAQSADPTLAALASREAAARYGLHSLAEDVQDRDDNRTRFLVVAAEEADHGHVAGTCRPTESAGFRSTLLLRLANTPGALAHALAPFAHRGVNLTHIQSTPAEVPWTYRFILELDAAASDERAAAAIDEVRASGAEVRVIGSYPAAPGAAAP